MPFSSIDDLFAALVDERPGDVVTALEHSLQCAWLLKQQSSPGSSTTSRALSNRVLPDVTGPLARSSCVRCWGRVSRHASSCDAQTMPLRSLERLAQR